MKIKPEKRRLYVFIGYNPEELAATPDYSPPFSPGDVLVHLSEEKAKVEGDALSVMRLRDGISDMVWPEEVKLL